MKKEMIIGCVADDFTGASDAASYLKKGGLQTQLYLGCPADDEDFGGAQAVVIGLKTRSIPAAEAVAQTCAAVRKLLMAGARQIYLKYCSTFDSTPKGNIGPVADAVMRLLGVRYTLLCPSLPDNGRTVRGGELFVNGVPLAQSPMNAHPINPMWASRLDELMMPQCSYPCFELPDIEQTEEQLLSIGADSEHFYLVPDYVDRAQGDAIAARFCDAKLLTGGSGLLEALAARQARDPDGTEPEELQIVHGAGVVLCGSCSQRSEEQIRCYLNAGRPALQLDPAKLESGEQTLCQVEAFLAENSRKEPLIYSCGGNQQGAYNAAYAPMLERTFAHLGSAAVAMGYRRIVVAGGETSGAVLRALGLRRFRIGSSVAPGVPLLKPIEAPELRLVLKSGNFGAQDFFLRALEQEGKNDG